LIFWLPDTCLQLQNRRSVKWEFLELTAQLSNRIGKSDRSRGLTLDQLVAFSNSEGGKITVRTHKRMGITLSVSV
jgi:hypothetical protein